MNQPFLKIKNELNLQSICKAFSRRDQIAYILRFNKTNTKVILAVVGNSINSFNFNIQNFIDAR